MAHLPCEGMQVLNLANGRSKTRHDLRDTGLDSGLGIGSRGVTGDGPDQLVDSAPPRVARVRRVVDASMPLPVVYNAKVQWQLKES